MKPVTITIPPHMHTNKNNRTYAVDEAQTLTLPGPIAQPTRCYRLAQFALTCTPVLGFFVAAYLIHHKRTVGDRLYGELAYEPNHGCHNKTCSHLDKSVRYNTTITFGILGGLGLLAPLVLILGIAVLAMKFFSFLHSKCCSRP
ncbi:hypothetical protein [Chlamydia vaughanii]|uniref:hypothetical protein n=1 Tax=Chlamydia vaughanii TaxID=3112552 RepID=UPI0032B155ED